MEPIPVDYHPGSGDFFPIVTWGQPPKAEHDKLIDNNILFWQATENLTVTII